MINLSLPNSPKIKKEGETASTSHENDSIDNEEQNEKDMDKNKTKEPQQQLRVCGRSYSSAKALKDHVKTVHMDTNIYSCHVSIILVMTAN